MNRFNALILTLAMLGPVASAQAGVIQTLIDENFSSGSASSLVWTSNAAGVSNGQQWTWSSPDASTTVSSTEVWTGAGGASARGLATTYDDDQNGGTPNVTIPGGFEVMSTFTIANPDRIRVAVQVTLPTDLLASFDGTLTFFAANRISSSLGGNEPRVSVFNVTDNHDILALTGITYPGGNSNWNFKSIALSLIAADAGDVIEVRFQEAITGGGGGGARGLEIADVNLAVTVVPTPAALPAGLGLMALIGLRRRKP